MQKGTESLKIIKIVLDVMSPAQQSIVDLVDVLSKIKDMAHIDITLSELEKNVEDFKVTLEGYNLEYETIQSAVKEFGAVIRNVDNIVSAEEYIPKQNHDKLSASMLVLARYTNPTVSRITQVYDDFDKTLEYVRSQKL